MYVVAYETSSKTENFFLDHALSMDNVCNRCLFSIPSKVEMAEEQEYLQSFLRLCMGQREVLAVHDFSVQSYKLLVDSKTIIFVSLRIMR